MQCSLAHGSYLFIGALNKLYLIDMANEFSIVAQLIMKRHIFTICSASANQFVVGEQSGYLAMVDVSDDGALTLQVENQVTDAIFKVVKTRTSDTDEAEFALACSSGLYFARYQHS